MEPGNNIPCFKIEVGNAPETFRSPRSAANPDKSKITNLKEVVKEKDLLISHQNHEIKEMKHRLTETNNDLCALTDEIATLKQGLGKKHLHIKHLMKEREELLEELQRKTINNNDLGRHSFKLESIFTIEKEKLKLADYENSFRDKKILSLERQLKHISEEPEKQAAQHASQRRKISWKRVGNIANEISQEDLDRLRQRSKVHSHGNRYRISHHPHLSQQNSSS